MRATKRLRLTRTACLALMGLSAAYLILVPPGAYEWLLYGLAWAGMSAGIAGTATTTDRLKEKK